MPVLASKVSGNGPKEGLGLVCRCHAWSTSLATGFDPLYALGNTWRGSFSCQSTVALSQSLPLYLQPCSQFLDTHNKTPLTIARNVLENAGLGLVLICGVEAEAVNNFITNALQTVTTNIGQSLTSKLIKTNSKIENL